MVDLFGYKKPRQKRRVMMHVSDAGNFPNGGKAICFECNICGYETGWIADERSISENKRGMACPDCNLVQEAAHG